MTDALTPPGPVAFIGLGKMGLPMALCLVKAGYDVRGFDISTAARDAFAKAGGTAVPRIEDALAGARAAITILPEGKAVKAALLGKDPHNPPVKALPKGAVVIEMSSSSPVDTVELGKALAATGHALIDAPVSGGVKRAREGTIAIMIGGEGEAVARCRPLLEAMGRTLFEVGPLGAGHAMKALNNYVSAAGLAAAAEAVIIGERFGLDPAVMVDVLNNSTGRNNATEVKMHQFVLSGTYGSGFSLGHMTKDLGTAKDLARHLGMDETFAATCEALWKQANETLGPDADHTEVHRFLKKG